MIKELKYISAKTLGEAVQYPKGTFLAGGTDLVPLMKYEVKNVETLISLDAIEELHQITITDDTVMLGAMVTLNALCNHVYIAEQYAGLSFAARCVASPQIRNIGTIGGNIMQDRRCIYFNQSAVWRASIEKCFKTGGSICHQAPASPVCRAIYYSDVATALYALDAQVVLYNGKSISNVPIAEVLEKHSTINGTFEKEHGLIIGFCLPNKGQIWSKFMKESIRDAIDFPTFNAAATIIEDNIHLAVGAIGSTPVRLTGTEDFIAQHKTHLRSVKEQLKELAMKEIYAKAVLIREDTISIPVKKRAMKSALTLIDAVIQKLG